MTSWRARLLRWLRVPPEPEAPFGDEHVCIFRAAPNFFRYRLILWSVRQIGAAVALVVYLVILTPYVPDWGPPAVTVGRITVTKETFLTILSLLEMGGLVVFVAQMIASGAILRLDFEQRWYLVSDRSLRIREGLVRLNEKTMTFANVQHVAIRQNPIQRWLGIADLEVRTAGGGAGGKDEHGGESGLHTGYLRGVIDPERIRDVIRERLRRHGDTGLGDPDHLPIEAQPATAGSSELVTAAAALREEARALRLAVAEGMNSKAVETHGRLIQ